jgi:GST-like protein
MIDLYFAATPNGLKMKLFLEEAGLPNRVVRVDLGKGEQRHGEVSAPCAIEFAIV